MMKIKLRSYDSVIYTEEHSQEVKYLYSIDDSMGLLEIHLTIPEEADPVETFVLDMKNLYRGFEHYVVYHSKYKYDLLVDRNSYQLNKIKMW